MNHTSFVFRCSIPLFIIVACFVIIFPISSQAEEVGGSQWGITADKITRFEDPRSLVAEGNVELIKTETVQKIKTSEEVSDWSALLEEPVTETAPEPAAEEIFTESKTLTLIRADYVLYDMDKGTIKARDNIYIEIGADKLYAEKGILDLSQETGTFHNAKIIRKEKQLHLEGRVIKKTGNLTYQLDDAWIITCKLEDGETPPWSFRAGHADVTLDSYAVLKDTSFRIKDIPVFWTPYGIIPIKQTRQTGFLFPEFSLSDRDGFGLNLPLFINISPSTDMTLYPNYMANRGLMAGAEFRYMLGDDNRGNFRANYLNDDLTDPAETEYYADGNFTHTNQDRYWIRGKANHDFGEWVSRLDIDIVSDRDYLLEFKSGLSGFNDTNNTFKEMFGRGVQNQTTDNRSNSFKILRSWEDMSLIGELFGVNDVRAVKTDPTPLWKLPALTFMGRKPVYKTMLDLSWDVNYVNYWRENGVGGHRLDIFPRVSMPVALSDYLETSIELGVRNTSYLIEENGNSDWSGSDSENRFLPTLAVDISTTLKRNFSIDGEEVYAWDHTLRPFLKYYYIPDIDQDDLPQFDSVDNIGENNSFVYGVNNFFNLFGSDSGGEYQREFAYFKIQQAYDLRDSQSDEPFGPIQMKLGVTPQEQLQLALKSDLDVYGDDLILLGVEANYTNSRGDSLSADYRHKKLENINSIKADAKVHFFNNVFAAYSIERSIEDDETLDQIIGFTYKPACWSVELSSHYTPSSHKIMLLFTLTNIGENLGVSLFKD